MRRPSRTRRILKWAGLVACVLLALTLVASRWWSVERRGGTVGGMIGKGRLVVLKYGNPDNVSWHVRRYTLPGFYSWYSFRCGAKPVPYVRLPLWSFLLIIGVPTAWLWWRDRSYPAGHCGACGYDLTGNVSGVCSECGEPASPDPNSSA